MKENNNFNDFLEKDLSANFDNIENENPKRNCNNSSEFNKSLIFYSGKEENVSRKSICINNNSEVYKTSNFYPYKENKKKLKKRFYICKNCESSPKITFVGNNLLNLKCDCNKLNNLRTNDFIEFYSENKNNANKYLGCKDHYHCKYKYYCFNCKVNLCEECLIDKIHENHLKQSLFLNKEEFDEVKKIIKNVRKKLHKGDIEYRKILNIIESIIKKYKEYPSHNLYKSIFKFKDFLSKLDIPLITKKIKIRKKEEPFNFKEDSLLISSIKINNQNFSDLSIFNKLKLDNLQKLQLQGNNIKNIEPFLNCNFEKLKFLDLANNKLNDESFKNFDKLNFKDIRYINLYYNKIKSPSIFEKVVNYSTLKTFFVGKNLFDEREVEKNLNQKYYLVNLKKLGVTGNFTDKSVKILSNFTFVNLQKLYISRNNLSSLSFLKNVFCENLVSFWAIENNLTDYNDILKLHFKDKIEKINLKKNKISNIDNLLNFVKEFPSLKELVLLDNPIDLDKQENKQIIKEIKMKSIDISVGNSKQIN